MGGGEKTINTLHMSAQKIIKTWDLKKKFSCFMITFKKYTYVRLRNLGFILKYAHYFFLVCRKHVKDFHWQKVWQHLLLFWVKLQRLKGLNLGFYVIGKWIFHIWKIDWNITKNGITLKSLPGEAVEISGMGASSGQ